MATTIFSNRNISLMLFILIVLFLGASFNVHVGPEHFENGESMPIPTQMNPNNYSE